MCVLEVRRDERRKGGREGIEGGREGMEGGRGWRDGGREWREKVEGEGGGREWGRGEGSHAVSTLSSFPAVNLMWHALVMTKQQHLMTSSLLQQMMSSCTLGL